MELQMNIFWKFWSGLCLQLILGKYVKTNLAEGLVLNGGMQPESIRPIYQLSSNKLDESPEKFPEKRDVHLILNPTATPTTQAVPSAPSKKKVVRRKFKKKVTTVNIVPSTHSPSTQTPKSRSVLSLLNSTTANQTLTTQDHSNKRNVTTTTDFPTPPTSLNFTPTSTITKKPQPPKKRVYRKFSKSKSGKNGTAKAKVRKVVRKVYVKRKRSDKIQRRTQLKPKVRKVYRKWKKKSKVNRVTPNLTSTAIPLHLNSAVTMDALQNALPNESKLLARVSRRKRQTMFPASGQFPFMFNQNPTFYQGYPSLLQSQPQPPAHDYFQFQGFPPPPPVQQQQQTEAIQPSDIESSDIRPSDVQPSDIEPSDIQSSDSQPSDVLPRDIQSMDPTGIGFLDTRFNPLHFHIEILSPVPQPVPQYHELLAVAAQYVPALPGERSSHTRQNPYLPPRIQLPPIQ